MTKTSQVCMILRTNATLGRPQLGRQLFWYSLDCKAVATRRIPDTYKPKPNPYLNTNSNPNPTNPTSILCKDSRKDFTLNLCVVTTGRAYGYYHDVYTVKTSPSRYHARLGNMRTTTTTTLPCIESKVYQNTVRPGEAPTGKILVT